MAAQPAAVQPKRVPVVPESLAPAPEIPPVQADVSMKEEDDLCQAFSDALCPIDDIDQDDADVPQLCSEYVKDIYVYLRSLEVGLSASRKPVYALSFLIRNLQPPLCFLYRLNSQSGRDTWKVMTLTSVCVPF